MVAHHDGPPLVGVHYEDYVDHRHHERRCEGDSPRMLWPVPLGPPR